MVTESRHARPIRRGEKSVTSMEHPRRSAAAGTETPGSGPCATWNGMPRSLSLDSSSLSPRSMKQYCLAPALANSGTSAKTTCSGRRCSRATARAWQSAQLSIARWSRDIQYTTGPSPTGTSPPRSDRTLRGSHQTPDEGLTVAVASSGDEGDDAEAEDAAPRTPVLVGGLVVDVAARRGAHRLAHPVGGLGATAGRCVARTDMARASSVTPRRLVLAVARRARAAGASCELTAAPFRVSI